MSCSHRTAKWLVKAAAAAAASVRRMRSDGRLRKQAAVSDGWRLEAGQAPRLTVGAAEDAAAPAAAAAAAANAHYTALPHISLAAASSLLQRRCHPSNDYNLITRH